MSDIFTLPISLLFKEKAKLLDGWAYNLSMHQIDTNEKRDRVAEDYVNKLLLTIPVLDTSKARHEIVPTRTQSHRGMVDTIGVQYTIPFAGSPELWHYNGQQFAGNTNYIRREGNDIVFTFSDGMGSMTDQYKQQCKTNAIKTTNFFDQIFKVLKHYVDQYNQELPGKVNTAIGTQYSKLKGKEDDNTGLNPW